MAPQVRRHVALIVRDRAEQCRLHMLLHKEVRSAVPKKNSNPTVMSGIQKWVMMSTIKHPLPEGEVPVTS